MKKKFTFLLMLSFIGLSSVIAQGTLDSGLVAKYYFNGNANDESGNGNNGTVNGATLTTDRFGNVDKAYSFDGVSNFISCGSNAIYENQDHTISAWIKSTKKGVPQGIAGYAGDGGNSGYMLYVSDFDSLGIIEGNNWTDYGVAFADSTITNNFGWHFFLAIRNGGLVNLYVDGVLQSGSTNHTISFNSCELLIGQTGYWGGQFFGGAIDDIRIYNRSLNQSEITALYQEGGYSTLNQGLVAYYPFNGNANDESGNGNNGTVNGATLTTDRFGNVGKAYSFDGSDFINVIDNNTLDFGTNDFSISIWINPQYVSNLHIIGKDSYDGINAVGYFIQYSGLEYEKVNFTTRNNGEAGVLISNYIINPNEWTLITGVRQNNVLKLYINGVYDNSVSEPTPMNVSNDVNFKIGRFDEISSEYFNGYLDNIHIYNRALTETEITELYQLGQLATQTITVDAPATIQQNDTVEISINTSDLQAGDGIISYQFKLAYDSTRLSYLSNNLVGTIDNGGTVNINSGTAGLLNIGYITSTALSGAGSILKLKFIATETLGDAAFVLSDFLYNTTAITDLQNDTITVIDGISPTGAVTYSVNPAIVREGDALQITVTFDEAMADVPVPQISLSGENTLANTDLTKVSSTVYTYDYVAQNGNGNVLVSLATGTDIAGNLLVATPTSGEFFTIIPTVYGDIDTNDVVQAYDAALALQYSVGIDALPTTDPLPWSNWRVIVGNVDDAGDITANDASLILQYSIGLINTFPVEAAKSIEDPVADITITQDNNELVFTSTGELYGLNIFSNNTANLTMTAPVVLDVNMLSASNISGNSYNVGLCTAYMPAENANIIRIPFTCTANESLTFNMLINKNSVTKSVNVDCPLGISKAEKEAVGIYPNPANDKIEIKGLDKNSSIEIINIQGQTVYSQTLREPQRSTPIDISKLSNGVYTIKIKTNDGVIVKELIKQ